MAIEMMNDAVECETSFARDILQHRVAGLLLISMRQSLEYTAKFDKL